MTLPYTAITYLYSGWDIGPSFVPRTTASVQDQIYHPHAKGSNHWPQWSEHFAYSKAFFMNVRERHIEPKEKDKRTNTKSLSRQKFPIIYYNTLFCIYKYMWVYIYVYTHTVSVYIHIYIYTHTYIHITMYIHVYTYIHILYINMYIYIYICVTYLNIQMPWRGTIYLSSILFLPAWQQLVKA